jgi:hypothetical protein
VVLGVAGDGDADAETVGDFALGHGVNGVVGALGVNVGAERLEEMRDAGFAEEDDVVDGTKGGYQTGAGAFVEDRASGTFESAGAGVAVDGDDQRVAEGAGGFEIADVADMENVEAAIGEDNGLTALLVVADERLERF